MLNQEERRHFSVTSLTGLEPKGIPSNPFSNDRSKEMIALTFHQSQWF